MFHDLLNKFGSSKNNSKSIPVTLSTRIRLARNLKEFPFPGKAEEVQRRAVLCKCMDAMTDMDSLKESTSLEVDDLSELDRQILVEKHLISPELSQVDEGSGIVLSSDRNCCVMINEEDHLRIQVLQPGLEFEKVWKRADELDSKIESQVNYAYDCELGFLTACPTNLGTGLRASAMMHLPGLVMSKNMDKVINAVNQLGIAVRGLFGEGSDASGSIFQISNQQTLGESEAEIVDRLGNVLKTVIDHEVNARFKYLEDEREKLLDQIGRASGVLRGAYVVNSNEAMNLLSLMRLAVDFGMLPEKHRNDIDRLFIECQPGHIQYEVKEDIEPEARDLSRGTKLRREFNKLPSLDFDKLEQLA